MVAPNAIRVHNFTITVTNHYGKFFSINIILGWPRFHSTPRNARQAVCFGCAAHNGTIHHPAVHCTNSDHQQRLAATNRNSQQFMVVSWKTNSGRKFVGINMFYNKNFRSTEWSFARRCNRQISPMFIWWRCISAGKRVNIWDISGRFLNRCTMNADFIGKSAF